MLKHFFDRQGEKRRLSVVKARLFKRCISENGKDTM